MKVIQETTAWKDPSIPNHVYYVDDSMSKMVSYIPVGTNDKITFKKPIAFDRRGRSFTVLKTVKTEDSIQVNGSKGAVYTLTRNDGKWACSCPGFSFRGACKHTASAPAS